MRLSNNYSSSVAIEQYLLFFPTSYRFTANFKLLYWLYIYLLPLNMTLYKYTYICVRFEARLSRSNSKVHIFKLHKRQVSSPWHGCYKRPHKSHQKRRGAMVFPEDETLASLDFLQSDLHLSWRRMMKFTSIGTKKNTGKHQPWSSFERVVAENATNNISEQIWITISEQSLNEDDSIPTYFSADFEKTCNI